MSCLGRIAVGAAGGALGLAAVGWLGFQIPPANYPPPDGSGSLAETVTVPADLPPPVGRYFRAVAGERVPLVRTAIAWGRPRIRLNRLWVPVRYRSYFVAGRAYYREMQATWCGIPVLSGYESYIEGRGVTEIGGQLQSNMQGLDQASNLSLWSEALWMPSALLTEPRVRWEGQDATTAALIVPYGDGEDRFQVRFDAGTGLIAEMRTTRYKSLVASSVGWSARPLAWQTFQGIRLPTRIAITWADEGTPWTEWVLEGIAYNVNVSARLRQPAGS